MKMTSSLARLSLETSLQKSHYGSVCGVVCPLLCLQNLFPGIRKANFLSAYYVAGSAPSINSLYPCNPMRSTFLLSHFPGDLPTWVNTCSYMCMSPCLHKMCSCGHLSLCLYIHLQTDLYICMSSYIHVHVCVYMPSCYVLIHNKDRLLSSFGVSCFISITIL